MIVLYLDRQVARIAMIQHDLHARALAQEIGVTESTVSRWVNGRRHVPERHVAAVRDALRDPKGLFLPEVRPRRRRQAEEEVDRG